MGAPAEAKARFLRAAATKLFYSGSGRDTGGAGGARGANAPPLIFKD